MRFDGEVLDQMRAVAGEAANHIVLSTKNQRQPTANRAAICCLICGAVSFHPNDVSERYCFNCHQWFEFMPSWKEAVSVAAPAKFSEEQVW